MGNNKRRKKNAETALPPDQMRPRSKLGKIMLAACVPLALACIAGWHFYPSRAATANVKNPVFAQDIAPLIHQRCAGCHHAGGSAPFALISYADVSKRAAQIVKVTQSRFMPPWLPEHGYGNFEGERHLSDDELAMLKNWAVQGAVEGDPARAPAAPRFNDDWQLGPPDLVVQLPRAYTLPAEGRDVYRNFVVPVPITQDRFVKGLEFRAGTTRIHHAFIYADRTPASRKREGREFEPGWPGMGSLPPSAESPSGQFTSWQPGRIARVREDMAWRWPAGSDLVLQLHMQTSGKTETIQPSVAFYFTDRPGTIHPTIILLRSAEIDIPAGAKAYTVRAQYTLPIDVDVLGVLPHVHYLGKDLRGFATLPDGGRTWLLWIKDWNFNWQSDFAYKQPLFLPKGSRLEMEYTFDNSAENPFNPSMPPKRVQYGPQSSDEMAELWVQLVPHADAEPRTSVSGISADAQILKLDRDKADMADLLALNNVRLRQNPSNAHAHLQLGKAMLVQGQMAAAEEHLRSAVKFDDGSSEAHYFMGYLLQYRIKDARSFKECVAEFRRAIELDRENYEALNGLGLTLYEAGNPREAEPLLVEALRLRPHDPVIERNLALTRKALGK